MKKRALFMLLVLATTLIAVPAFAEADGGGCIKKYMDVLEICMHMDDLIEGNICHMDATMDYIGCIRKTLVF
jgi:hypothetical protein